MNGPLPIRHDAGSHDGGHWSTMSVYDPETDRLVLIELDIQPDGTVTWRPRGAPVGQRGLKP